jgi:hypothetical protein
MASRRYRSSSRSYPRARTSGYERALQHIEEARQLSEELGGTDKDVKDYFFTLPPAQLAPILDEYERRFGKDKREYAELTLPKWRTGRVAMSGLVASRLFSLLPPTMPLPQKYKLTENLWRHVGPSSRKRLRIGLDSDLNAVVSAVRAHIEDVVIHYRIPDGLERRFQWLSAGDVGIKQELLNHLRNMEKSLVIDGASLQLPVMLAHLSGAEGINTHRLAQVLKIGKHELEILVDTDSTGVKLEEPAPIYRTVSAATTGQKGNWFFWIVAALGVLWLLSKLSGH